MTPISLTGLTLVADCSLPTTEVCVHPDIIERVRAAFREADLLRSIRQSSNVTQFPHPFSSVELAPPPYPFCHSPKQCAGKGYCTRDPACNN